MSEAWFQSVFGFPENGFSQTKAMFSLEDDPSGGKNTILKTKTGKQWFVGDFSVPTVSELRQRLATAREAYLDSIKDAMPACSGPASAAAGADAAGGTDGGMGARQATLSAAEQENLKKKKEYFETHMKKGLKYSTLANTDIRSVIHNSGSASGSVFQAASQFNALEFVGPGERTESGISKWSKDPTQGPAVALSAPASTFQRAYFCGGPTGTDPKGQVAGNHINTMHKVEELINNEKNKYWRMTNGYLLPVTTASMGELAERIGPHSSDLARNIVEQGAVAVHWDTDVGQCPSKHRATFVYASAVPVGYAKSTTVTNWASFATLALEIAYTATVAVAAIRAWEQGRRVQCFLTTIGLGAFENNSIWVKYALEKAMFLFKDHPVDIIMVFYDGGKAAFKNLSVPKVAPRVPLVERGVARGGGAAAASSSSSGSRSPSRSPTRGGSPGATNRRSPARRGVSPGGKASSKAVGGRK